MVAATPRWATLPTSRPFHRGLYRRLCSGIVHPRSVNLSLWTSLAIKIWWSYRLTWSLPPPPSRWPALPTSPSFHRGLYRRLCGGIVHPRSVNLGLWTFLASKIWWSYRLTCSLPPPDGQRCLRCAHFTAASTDADARGVHLSLWTSLATLPARHTLWSTRLELPALRISSRRSPTAPVSFSARRSSTATSISRILPLPAGCRVCRGFFPSVGRFLCVWSGFWVFL
jgi:hypothetical protein